MSTDIYKQRDKYVNQFRDAASALESESGTVMELRKQLVELSKKYKIVQKQGGRASPAIVAANAEPVARKPSPNPTEARSDDVFSTAASDISRICHRLDILIAKLVTSGGFVTLI